MSEPFEESHFQCRTLWWRHPSQGTSNSFERAAQLGTADKIRFDGYDHIRDVRLWPSLAERVDCTVPRDHGQPTREASTSRVERIWTTPELHENFLQNVLRRSSIAQNSQRDRINDRRVALI